MAYTQTQIDALKKAIATGVLEVEHGEVRTKYRSLAEMKSILADMEVEVNGRSRTTIGKFNNGAF